MASILLVQGAVAVSPPPKPRLIVLSDIGNEPDDQMSLVRLLLYSNALDIEGLVATTSTWQRTKASPEIMKTVIAAYGKVRSNLLLHATGWPTQAALDAMVSSGQSQYGIAAIGPDKMTAGAQAIIDAADKQDDRPLWVSVWGGANTLAQALSHVKSTRTPDALNAFVAKLRVYSISDQDDAGPWIRREFPQLFYIVKPSTPDSGEYGSATWTGISGDQYYRNGPRKGQGTDFITVSNEWLEDNIRSKGPLGQAYPKYMFIMEGDTPAFLGLIPNGLNAAETPNYGGWGGRYIWRQPYGETHPIWTQGGDMFRRVSSADTINDISSDQATIWRWRSAFQHDFAARMDWTIRPFKQANHPPIVAVAAPESITIKLGETRLFDASASTDPDGNALGYHWFHYGEAGFSESTNMAGLTLKNTNTAKVSVTAAQICRKLWLDGLVPCQGSGIAHLILAVTDNGTPALTRYKRIIITVESDR